jgi:hypothetical protein
MAAQKTFLEDFMLIFQVRFETKYNETMGCIANIQNMFSRINAGAVDLSQNARIKDM